MKLLKHNKDEWQYELNRSEGDCLQSLLKQFPITKGFPNKISRTDPNPETVEREKLLNESMAHHREQLKKLAGNLISADKIKASQNGWRLSISPEERETLFQILNDIRVGCWRVLGEPENLESKTSPPSDKELMFYNLMNLAGYFEHKLLNLPD